MQVMEPSHKYGSLRVVGLYGVEGIGKSTISKVVYNQMFGDFDGKSSYVELGDMNLIELQKRVLQGLTEASLDILNNSHGQVWFNDTLLIIFNTNHNLCLKVAKRPITFFSQI